MRRSRLANPATWLMSWALMGYPEEVTIEELLVAPKAAFDTKGKLRCVDFSLHSYHATTAERLLSIQWDMWKRLRTAGVPAWVGKELRRRRKELARRRWREGGDSRFLMELELKREG